MHTIKYERTKWQINFMYRQTYSHREFEIDKELKIKDQLVGACKNITID